jgi:hypothetical protein
MFTHVYTSVSAQNFLCKIKQNYGKLTFSTTGERRAMRKRNKGKK